MMIDYKNTRIYKLREYLFGVLENILGKEDGYNINADMLDIKPGNFSLDKMPEVSTVSKDIVGNEIHKDVYNFRSRCYYSQDTMINLKNIGFFEIFEKVILEKNKMGELPEIDGIESIECLNSGSLEYADTQAAEFNIQIQINYKVVGGKI